MTSIIRSVAERRREEEQDSSWTDENSFSTAGLGTAHHFPIQRQHCQQNQRHLRDCAEINIEYSLLDDDVDDIDVDEEKVQHQTKHQQEREVDKSVDLDFSHPNSGGPGDGPVGDENTDNIQLPQKSDAAHLPKTKINLKAPRKLKSFVKNARKLNLFGRNHSDTMASAVSQKNSNIGDTSSGKGQLLGDKRPSFIQNKRADVIRGNEIEASTVKGETADISWAQYLCIVPPSQEEESTGSTPGNGETRPVALLHDAEHPRCRSFAISGSGGNDESKTVKLNDLDKPVARILGARMPPTVVLPPVVASALDKHHGQPKTSDEVNRKRSRDASNHLLTVSKSSNTDAIPPELIMITAKENALKAQGSKSANGNLTAAKRIENNELRNKGPHQKFVGTPPPPPPHSRHKPLPYSRYGYDDETTFFDENDFDGESDVFSGLPKTPVLPPTQTRARFTLTKQQALRPPFSQVATFNSRPVNLKQTPDESSLRFSVASNSILIRRAVPHVENGSSSSVVSSLCPDTSYESTLDESREETDQWAWMKNHVKQTDPNNKSKGACPLNGSISSRRLGTKEPPTKKRRTLASLSTELVELARDEFENTLQSAAEYATSIRSIIVDCIAPTTDSPPPRSSAGRHNYQFQHGVSTSRSESGSCTDISSHRTRDSLQDQIPGRNLSGQTYNLASKSRMTQYKEHSSHVRN